MPERLIHKLCFDLLATRQWIKSHANAWPFFNDETSMGTASADTHKKTCQKQVSKQYIDFPLPSYPTWHYSFIMY